jgi:basic membrane protein A and related proteins
VEGDTLRRSDITRFAAALAVGALVTVGLAGCGGSGAGGAGGNEKVVKVGLAYDVGGRGDKSFNDSAFAGLERVKKELNLQIQEVKANQGESDADKVNRLTLMARSGMNPIIGVGFIYSKSVEQVAKKYPNVHFAVVDGIPSKVPNVTALTFSEEQGSYLMGAAAALKSKSGTIGFIGGQEIPLIKKFEAGYRAGAQKVNPDIKFLAKYLGNTPDAFNDPAKGRVAAQGQYDAGADVIYHAAGRSGIGVFEAAADKKQLCIGVDSDQYLTAKPEEQPYIMTSMLKRVDTAVFEFTKAAQGGSPRTGEWKFDLKSDGIGYAESNAQAIGDIKGKLDAYKKDIVDGKITVPTEVK